MLASMTPEDIANFIGTHAGMSPEQASFVKAIVTMTAVLVQADPKPGNSPENSGSGDIDGSKKDEDSRTTD